MKQIEGIILKKIPRREADFVIELYTKELGLAHFQAKGVRKHTAKLKSGLDIFNHIDLFYAPSKYMPITTDFKIKDDFREIKTDLKRLKMANFAAAIIRKIFEPGLADETAWKKISEFFLKINNTGVGSDKLSVLSYILCYQFLEIHGVKPELEKCVRCGRPVFEQGASVSLISGCITHYQCLKDKNIEPYRIANATLALSEDVLDLARKFDIKSAHEILDIGSNADIWRDFEKLTQILFGYHFGIDISKLI